MKVMVLTASTGRPEALALCRQFVARQTHPCTHVVSEGFDIFNNMRNGLETAEDYDAVVICEDDDWYRSDHVAEMVRLLEQAELVGQGATVSYHIPSSGFVKPDNNPFFCSLHSTAIRTSQLEALLRVLNHPDAVDQKGRVRIDVLLWRVPLSKRQTLTPTCVSMKGMPGTPGLSAKHEPWFYDEFDRDRSFLRYLIGDDVALYERFFDAARRLPR
jgi:hypothetical protein